ncbi:sigma-70 family RNA polymerase sigma factor [Kribbella sp. VKM Ac-2566]|uniref:sigma-70 family RNA polymerase sigma factor n=1 Tax=Kribbella sp. VKM Ac-2566 TaxID=2512218 RepID=UPI001063D8F2|nr:sigma-70 family RNA polymerase sigma factor [Kribbella sp. VKM Ac-2566]TDW92683.1 RNA polymerase sigma-70 factor (ECF subfamily) [Kribbella sp. VKM Ac-2566]
MTTLEEAAFAGDESAFAALAGRYRRELHVHCYRMLGSYDEAEDAVQDTLLRAWRARDSYDGRTYFRAWLYKIATNICLDVVRRPAARDLVWLQPYPDRLLDEIAPSDDRPDMVAVDRETIELTFLIALQALPPRQRATLIARDVLGWSAAETAGLLDTSVAAANSALQRARVTMQQRLPVRRSDWSAPQPTAEEREVLARFIDAHQRCDAAAAIAIAAEDLRISMPPDRLSFDGLTACLPLFERGLGPNRDGEWRLVPTSANRLPAAASYLLRPGDTVWRAFKLDVLRVHDGKIAEIMTFGYSRFPAFGLPDRLTP